MQNVTPNTIATRWVDLPAEQRAANTTTLNYIRALASQTGANISRWNLINTFGGNDETHLITDIRKINKAFFEKLMAVRRGPRRPPDPDEAVAAVARTERFVRRTLRDQARSEVQTLERQVQESRRDARRHLHQYERSMVSAARYARRLRHAQNDTSDHPDMLHIVDQLKQVLAEGVWCDPQPASSSHLWLRTATNIVNTYRNPEAGIDATIDLGEFACKIFWQHNRPRFEVYPFANNLVVQHVYHPHVSSEGNICWGDARYAMEDSADRNDIALIMSTLHALLMNYSPDNPYVVLEQYTTSDARPYRYGDLSLDYRHPSLDAARARQLEESIYATTTSNDTEISF